ncbi:Putative histone-lysine N-methyltransferase [Phytophthora palmivora]|uniref:Histone-lysine N-methyltransferase n=1 Tax=Phytophthora palmivora TaxID=4796 RepID=A0A2P4XLP7_9STRA|nr:Putative histone-lysine N-methyltransferase [Phytophthora palmivora]
MSSPEVVTTLLKWLKSHGGADNLLDIRYLGALEGHGVFAKQTLASGQVTLRVPFKLTMNIESAAQSDLAPVLEKYPQIPDDEVLALHLMHERSKGSTSFFAPFIASMPTTFDLPVFWTDAELNELQGTNVLLLTKLMKQQLQRDFENIHQAVAEDFPEIFASLPTLKVEDYMWAMSVIWSRAFGVSKGEKYLRLLCPAMDMFNHDVTLRNPLDDFVSFDEEKQMMTHQVPKEVMAGSPLHISYGQYSNAKLLYSYGFVVPENLRQAVDFWMKIPPTDPYLKLKQTVLDSNKLTQEQTYDFCGTLFKNDVDERLLATLRVILMNEQEIRLYKKAFESSILSARNELAVYENLQSSCLRKLANYPTTLEEDETILAETKTELDPRLSFAVRVRIEDKQVLSGVIDTLEQWKLSLVSNPEKYPPSSTRS